MLGIHCTRIALRKKNRATQSGEKMLSEVQSLA